MEITIARLPGNIYLINHQTGLEHFGEGMIGQTDLLVKEVLTIGKIELFPFLELNLNTMM